MAAKDVAEKGKLVSCKIGEKVSELCQVWGAMGFGRGIKDGSERIGLRGEGATDCMITMGWQVLHFPFQFVLFCFFSACQHGDGNGAASFS